MSLGPGVAERLSKPTASSISKARAPTLVMSPPRGGAAGTKSASTTARGGAAVKRGGVPATRGGLRPKTGVGATVAKAKEQKGATVVQEKVEEVHQDVEEDHHEEEHQIEQEIEQEHQHDPVGSANTTVTLVDTPSQDLVQEPEEHEDLSVFAKDDASSLVDEDLDSVHDFTGEHYEVLSSEDVAPAQVSHELVFEEHDTNGVQDELDDMVNLLETKPLFNSATTFATSEGVMKEVEGKSVEDVVLEIPDEE